MARGSQGVKELINTAISGTAGRAFPPLQDNSLSGEASSHNTSLVQIVTAGLDDTKAEDITVIDLNGKTSIADAMIVATGRSSVHVGSIADRVIRALKDSGRGVPRVEGLQTGDWVLIDAGDIIVHVFRPEVRQFYNLEKMWGSGRPLERHPV